METNRVEDVARDGISTASTIARTAAEAGSEVATDVVVAVGGAMAKTVREAAQMGEQASFAALSSLGRVAVAAREANDPWVAFARSAASGWIETVGIVIRSAMRASAGVAVEAIDSIRSTVAAVVLVRHDDAAAPYLSPRAANGGGSIEVAGGA